MTTHRTILARHDIHPADQAIADIDVPILTGPQRQGDVLIAPRPPLGRAELASMTPLPAAGIPVVRGEATGNTHILTPEHNTTVMWSPTEGDLLRLGVLHVPAGAVAWLVHTDEHGVNGIGPGTYIVTGKREQADELRRVAD